jgi:hypothetical protein
MVVTIQKEIFAKYLVSEKVTPDTSRPFLTSFPIFCYRESRSMLVKYPRFHLG